MPIYAYKCDSCGFAKDVLQKLSDAPLSECPSCHAATFSKQLTAAGFQLKGSGWYVTDFRDGNKGAAPASDGKSPESGAGKTEGGGDAKPTGTTATKTESPSGSKPAAESAVSKPAATPTTGTGTAG